MSRGIAFRLLAPGLAIAVACVTPHAGAQQLRTFSEAQVGANFLTYGLPVPLPVDSLTPVDGFRRYESLHARLQGLAMASSDLAAHEVGRSGADRAIWAYVASDEDGVDVEGRPESAFFINAATHAREWATPEVSTGTLERLIDGAGDQGIVRYLLDNTRVVVVPVHNVDGFLQTQRYPTDAIVGQDPDMPALWPRDGRMRRKNMHGVDEVLATFADHLGGVDLNRNHPPFWATSTSSSPDPRSLVHHGGGAHSEAENRALLGAAALGPETRLRLGIDLHTFSQVFFSSNTARSRLNLIQRSLITRLRTHHAALSGKTYTDIQDPANRGIGAAAEYFAYQWLVPAWTLEIEPINDATEYGGTAVTHGGFILPAAQARRVRESWAETHLVAFYRMAGPAHLARVRYIDLQSGTVAREVRWQWSAQRGLRERVAAVDGGLMPGRRYRAELSFSKPMRWRDAHGNPAPLPGNGIGPADPSVVLLRGATRVPLNTSQGAWSDAASQRLRYRGDTFVFEFDAPSDSADYTLEVTATDLLGMNIDADPATPADWAQGAWSEYENADGLDGDIGGSDRSTAVRVSADAALPFQVLPAPRIAGEGDRVTLHLRRAVADSQTLSVTARLEGVEDAFPVTWAAGESGDRTLSVPMPDDLLVGGDRVARVVLSATRADTAVDAQAIDVRVLDNDRAERGVVALDAGDAFGPAWAQVASAAPTPRELVLRRGEYAIDEAAPAGPLAPVHSTLRVHGNHAVLRPTYEHATAPLLQVAADGRLTLQETALIIADTPSSRPALIDNHGSLSLERSVVSADVQSSMPALLRNTGTLRVERSGLLGVPMAQDSSVIEQVAGSTRLHASSLLAGDRLTASSGAGLRILGGTLEAQASSLSAPLLVQEPAASLLRAQASILQEQKAGLRPPITAPRPPCDATVIAGDGGNVFTADYYGQFPDSWRDSACFTLQPSDVFDASVRLVAAAAPSPDPLLLAGSAGVEVDFVAGDACGAVDQRGAPRPQHAGTQAGDARCDAGAYELGINPYRGIWSPERSGHGVDIQTNGNRLLIAWYTYADDGQPTAYQAVAPLAGRQWRARLQQPRRDPATGVVALSDVGEVTIDFDDDANATLGWRFDARGTRGSERIRAALFAPGEPRVEVTGLWYPPRDSGYGATIARRGEVTAIGLYYYDAQGNVRWALGNGDGADAMQLAMTSFTGFCPDCDAVQMPVTPSAAGTLLAHFHTPREARLDMTLSYPRGAGGTWTREQAHFIPLSDPVDNRAAAMQAQQR